MSVYVHVVSAQPRSVCRAWKSPGPWGRHVTCRFQCSRIGDGIQSLGLQALKAWRHGWCQHGRFTPSQRGQKQLQGSQATWVARLLIMRVSLRKQIPAIPDSPRCRGVSLYAVTQQTGTVLAVEDVRSPVLRCLWLDEWQNLLTKWRTTSLVNDQRGQCSSFFFPFKYFILKMMMLNLNTSTPLFTEPIKNSLPAAMVSASGLVTVWYSSLLTELFCPVLDCFDSAHGLRYQHTSSWIWCVTYVLCITFLRLLEGISDHQVLFENCVPYCVGGWLHLRQLLPSSGWNKKKKLLLLWMYVLAMLLLHFLTCWPCMAQFHMIHMRVWFFFPFWLSNLCHSWSSCDSRVAQAKADIRLLFLDPQLETCSPTYNIYIQ